MEVSIILRCVTQSSGPRTWNIEAGLPTGESLGSLVLDEPSQSFDEKEVIWYLEDFALNDPYSDNRAQMVAQHLDNYAIQLARHLIPTVSRALQLTKAGDNTVSLCLHIQASDSALNIHSVKWELLEREAAGFELCNIGAVLVIRQMAFVSSIRVSPPRQSTLNILFLSARNTFGDSIPYRIISLPVWELAKTAREQGRRVELYFARPGTWQNFRSIIGGYAEEFFSIVHLDLHGIRLRDQRSGSSVHSRS